MNSIRKIIFEECDYPICAESIEELKAILENVAHKIVIEAMAEFDELNGYRRKHGLRELKRLNSYAIKKGAEKVLNGVLDVDMGLQSRMAISPGGKKCNHVPPKFAVEIQ
ncbi:MAG: hypothetical protein DRN17_01780 [Thermoplasmata archaeon]|nr:MAG: hypothetical protein DRN17_01780 [Thermoplasmata archaeon]